MYILAPALIGEIYEPLPTLYFILLKSPVSLKVSMSPLELKAYIRSFITTGEFG